MTTPTLTPEVLAELKRLNGIKDTTAWPSYLATLLIRHRDELIACAERELARSTRQGTHWEGCWESHGDCAIIHARAQQKRIAELEETTRELEKRAALMTEQRDAAMWCEEEAKKRIAELESALEAAQRDVRQCDQDENWRNRETILQGGGE